MKRLPKLFKCEIARAKDRLLCDHSNKHPILPGNTYCKIGTPRGQKKPICKNCSVEMIIAAHAQLRTFMEGFKPQATGRIREDVRPQIKVPRHPTEPRKMFKTEIAQAEEATLCGICKRGPVQPGAPYGVVVIYTKRQITLCQQCAWETARLADEQLQEVMGRLNHNP